MIDISTLTASLVEITKEYDIFLEYKDLEFIFSKKASNVLPLYYWYNHKIELEPDAELKLRFSPLYKMSILELETIK